MVFGDWHMNKHRVVLVRREASAIIISMHCISRNVRPLQLAIILTYTVRLRQCLAQMLPKKLAIKIYFIFPPHLTSTSALPGETGNPEIASFHLSAACVFAKKHQTQLKISPGQS